MKRFLILYLIILSTKLFAETSFDQAAETAQIEGLKRQSSSIQQANQFNGNAIFNSYTTHPNEVKYYDGNETNLML